MFKRFTILLIIVMLPILFIGCQKPLDGDGELKSARPSPPSSISSGKVNSAADTGSKLDKRGEVVGTGKAYGDGAVDEEALDLQEEIDSLAEDLKSLENPGGEDAIAEIDRELDGF